MKNIVSLYNREKGRQRKTGDKRTEEKRTGSVDGSREEGEVRTQ